MIVTRKYINRLRNSCMMQIDKALEGYILSEYEEGPFPYEYTEQDLCEQIRKLANEYNAGRLAIPSIPSRHKRLQKRCGELKKDFPGAAPLYCERCGGLPEQPGCMNTFMGVGNSSEEGEYD
jgi:hypothetical protein